MRPLTASEISVIRWLLDRLDDTQRESAPVATEHCYFVGTRAFNSSLQCSTTTMPGVVAF
jgi:hypothetical protein